MSKTFYLVNIYFIKLREREVSTYTYIKYDGGMCPRLIWTGIESLSKSHIILRLPPVRTVYVK